MTERKQNTPSKQAYWRGKGSNPRPVCPKCGRYMIKPRAEFTVSPGVRGLVYPVLVCKCGYVEVKEEELKKIPD